MTQPAPPNDTDDGFFVGYLNPVPGALKRFAWRVALVWLGAMALGAGLLVRATDDPGPGHYVAAPDGTVFVGLVEALPYPLLRVAASAGQPAKTYLLAAPGKQGAQDVAVSWAGQRVLLQGVALQRGDLDMLLVTEPVQAVPGDAPPAAPSLAGGLWEMTGEICDGKCFAGAMKPGTGLAHKACANLCLEGGLPPVLVTREPVAGHTTFLLATARGEPLDASLLDVTARPVRVLGTVEWRDSLAILRLVPGTLQLVP